MTNRAKQENNGLRSLSIIGCGTIGKALGRLFYLKHIFQIRQVLNRSHESSKKAVEFLGAGTPVSSFDELDTSDVFMISTSDDKIKEACCRLSETNVLRNGDTVFHCSGSISSEALLSAKENGAIICSVHPIKSFPNPNAADYGLQGAYCGVEGDEEAVRVLTEAFERIGGVIFSIDPHAKTLYHAGTIFGCGYIVSLIEMVIKCYEQAGISRDLSMKILSPIVQDTVNNAFALGTSQALTGPITRGDHNTVLGHIEALSKFNKNFETAYKALGQVAVELSAKRGIASNEDLQVISEYLSQHSCTS